MDTRLQNKFNIVHGYYSFVVDISTFTHVAFISTFQDYQQQQPQPYATTGSWDYSQTSGTFLPVAFCSNGSLSIYDVYLSACCSSTNKKDLFCLFFIFYFSRRQCQTTTSRQAFASIKRDIFNKSSLTSKICCIHGV